MGTWWDGTPVKNKFETPLGKYRHLVKFVLSDGDPVEGQEPVIKKWTWLAGTDASAYITATEAELDAAYQDLKDDI